MSYYNRELDCALRRYKQSKANIKDLYYRELLTFKKDYTQQNKVERWESLYDIILLSYEETRNKKSDVFLFLVSRFPDGADGYSFVMTHQDQIVGSLSLFGIKDFQFVYADCSSVFADYGVSLSFLHTEFVSNYGVLGKGKVTLEDGVIQIHGEVNTENILGGQKA